MAIALYAALIPPYVQILNSLSRLLDKAEDFCAERGLDPDAILQSRLADDMLPFAYQVKSAAVHSAGAIQAALRGAFSPDTNPPPESFEGLRGRVAEAVSALVGLGEHEVNALQGRPMRLEIRGHHADYLAEDFLLTFSKPNFYFHAATAYGLLRHAGLPIGKIDYLGPIALQKD